MELTPDQAALADAVRTLLTRHEQTAQKPPRPGSPTPHQPPAPDTAPPPSSTPHQPPAPHTAPPPSPAPHTAPPAFPAPYDPALWVRLCEIGVAGLAVPERYGGAGAGPVETHVVAEELGRRLTPSPLLGSAVLAAQALLACGDDATRERLLPAIADGTSLAALAWTGEAGHWDPAQAACAASGTPGSADGWVLDGEARYVLDGDTADVLLVTARAPDGIGLFEVDPAGSGVTRSAVATMDTTRRLATVALAGAPGRRVDDPAARPAPAALARARDLACIALSAEQVGAAAQALRMTADYVQVRVQFDRAIGGFQALQHRLADLHVLVSSARSLSYAAAQAAADQAAADQAGADQAGADQADELGLRAAAAKVYCSETLQQVAAETIQLHGAIGITWEHDAHRYLKRAHAAAQLFGQPAEHVARIAAAVIDG
ncbi:MAG TPA: acyl-CoA dehydrogenase family protein [Streptosporangiaceae bacterium]|nr:acyl-CoA dehydrogenase family protein [Streptosporangiaceae bacterium]